MTRLLHLILLGLIGAVIVHIAILLLVPRYSDKNAWSHIETLGDAYRFYTLDQKSGVLSNPDPLMRQAVCRFDLADGPVQIATRGAPPFWSLSVYAPNGDNLYSLNDNVSTEQALDLIIADSVGMAGLRAEGRQNDSRTILVEQGIGEGAIILRAFVPDSSWQIEVQRFFDEAHCALYEAG
ncbi:hypothetical protein DKP76_00195 [Falsochrobactrum shanghaiense]|uniref:DUF1254 domain-containing protein n=1 Tax=Falsochrobactrum shanghaiense TaxID=2201899 RepID=A0A316JCQ7_9HYPH|nr:hypothetical protein [Falsochrobactrum shanghaiense]PWL19041.1 hypothetical protein DKP76_00195 [Falsochrobactrum shanghaiense]